MKPLTELIAEAQQALAGIAAHDDYLAIIESEIWEYPGNSLSLIRDCLEDLAETANNFKEKQKQC